MRFERWNQTPPPFPLFPLKCMFARTGFVVYEADLTSSAPKFEFR